MFRPALFSSSSTSLFPLVRIYINYIRVKVKDRGIGEDFLLPKKFFLLLLFLSFSPIFQKAQPGKRAETNLCMKKKNKPRQLFFFFFFLLLRSVLRDDRAGTTTHFGKIMQLCCVVKRRKNPKIMGQMGETGRFSFNTFTGEISSN